MLRHQGERQDCFVATCAAHLMALLGGAAGGSSSTLTTGSGGGGGTMIPREAWVLRSAAFERRGMERGRRRLVLQLQAWWRGVWVRRRLVPQLRFARKVAGLTQEHLRSVCATQAMWRGMRCREGLRGANVRLPGDRRRAKVGRLVSRLQAHVRGSRVRRRLRRAREIAKLVDDSIGDLAEIDVDQFECPDVGEPFDGLSLPMDFSNLDAFLDDGLRAAAPPSSYGAVPAAASSSAFRRSSSDAGGGITAAGGSAASGASLAAALAGGPAGWPSPKRTPSRGGAGQPVAATMAWSTPPPTLADGFTAAPDHGLLGNSSSAAAPRQLSSAAAAAAASAGEIPAARQFSSRPSTPASSAAPVSEASGPRISKVQQVRQEWGFEDDATAQAFLKAQRRRSGLPPKGASAVQRKSVSIASGNRRSSLGSMSDREPAAMINDRRKGTPVKAQDAIAAYRRMKEDERRQAAQQALSGVPDDDVESVRSFQSEEPNAKLLRTSRGSSGGFG